MPIEQNLKLTTKENDDNGDSNHEINLDGSTCYQRLVGKLIYVIMTRPDFSYLAQVLRQFMHAPKYSHESAMKHMSKSNQRVGLLLSSTSKVEMLL